MRRRRRCEIVLDNPCRYRQIQARRLRPWLGALLAELAPAAGSLGVRFVSDRAMRGLNRDHRGRDRPTDVLSFVGDLAPADAADVVTRGLGALDQRRHLGDIVIAVPTAARQAAAGGRSVGRELRTLLLHGVLHCLGHDHETDDGAMERLERRLRRRWIQHD